MRCADCRNQKSEERTAGGEDYHQREHLTRRPSGPGDVARRSRVPHDPEVNGETFEKLTADRLRQINQINRDSYLRSRPGARHDADPDGEHDPAHSQSDQPWEQAGSGGRSLSGNGRVVPVGQGQGRHFATGAAPQDELDEAFKPLPSTGSAYDTKTYLANQNGRLVRRPRHNITADAAAEPEADAVRLRSINDVNRVHWRTTDLLGDRYWAEKGKK